MTEKPRDLAAAFDAMAAGYDERYEANPSMLRMRARVWHHLRAFLEPGSRVLELGCGSGIDTAWIVDRGARVLATDCSEGMLAVARRRVEARPNSDHASFRRLEISRLAELEDGQGFDLVLANFGGLNTVDDPAALEGPLLGLLRPGGRLAAGVMGRHCVWDWLIEAVRLRPSEILRRRRKEGTDIPTGGQVVRCYFPTPRELLRAFPRLPAETVEALGLLLPPPRATAGREAWRPLWNLLHRMERPLVGLAPFQGLGDHFLAILRKP